MTNKKILRFAAVALAALWLNLANAAGMGAEDARHLLNRAGFGATPEDIVEYSKLSREQGVERVLAPVGAAPKIAPPAELSEHVAGSKIKEMRENKSIGQKQVRQEVVRRGLVLQGWWVNEMLAADTPAEQLRERMVLFWHNHFVSSYAKVRASKAMLEQNQMFRANALGEFDDMLHAVAKSTAMVIYLDSATNRKDSPNENFAREVMELFTLGEGNYSEKDIKEAARAFTGWGDDRETGEFVFRKAVHDNGEKVLFGKSGNFDGDQALDIMLAQPKAAEFIVTKLWKEFVSPKPDMQEVQKIAAKFRESGYKLNTAVGGLLRSQAFWDQQNRGVMIKSPVELVIGTLHTFEVEKASPLPFAHAISQLGQTLFMPPNVKGWPGGDAWINSQSLLFRKQFIERLFRSESDRGDSSMEVAKGEKGSKGEKGMKGAKKDGDMGDDMKDGDMKDGEGGRMNKVRLEAKRDLEGIHIDTREWMRKVAALGLKPEQVLLATPAPKPVATQTDLRALLLDTTYQVR